jgi:hypothetical protein
MEKLNEIVEIGRAQDLILGGKDPGGDDSAVGLFRLTIDDAEEDE